VFKSGLWNKCAHCCCAVSAWITKNGHCSARYGDDDTSAQIARLNDEVAPEIAFIVLLARQYRLYHPENLCAKVCIKVFAVVGHGWTSGAIYSAFLVLVKHHGSKWRLCLICQASQAAFSITTRSFSSSPDTSKMLSSLSGLRKSYAR